MRSKIAAQQCSLALSPTPALVVSMLMLPVKEVFVLNEEPSCPRSCVRHWLHDVCPQAACNQMRTRNKDHKAGLLAAAWPIGEGFSAGDSDRDRS